MRALGLVGRLLLRLWAFPNTALGLVIAGIASLSGGRAAIRDGVLEAHGGMLRELLGWLPLGPRSGTAVTLGHVVIGSCAGTLAATRAHERVHVAQYERWGPLFLPAYAVASLCALLGGGDAYRDNRFERAVRVRR